MTGVFLLYFMMPSEYTGSDNNSSCLGCLQLRYEVGYFYGIMAEYLGGLLLMFVYK